MNHHFLSLCYSTLSLQVKSKVPWLADVLKLLQEAQELSQDLIDKVCPCPAFLLWQGKCGLLYMVLYVLSGCTVQINGSAKKVEVVSDILDTLFCLQIRISTVWSVTCEFQPVIWINCAELSTSEKSIIVQIHVWLWNGMDRVP